jgi:hypothetical protein
VTRGVPDAIATSDDSKLIATADYENRYLTFEMGIATTAEYAERSPEFARRRKNPMQIVGLAIRATRPQRPFSSRHGGGQRTLELAA